MNDLATVRHSRVSMCGCDKFPQCTCQTTDGTCARCGLRLFCHIIGIYLYVILYLILTARTRQLLLVFYRRVCPLYTLIVLSLNRSWHTHFRESKNYFQYYPSDGVHIRVMTYASTWHHTPKRIVVVPLTAGKWRTTFIPTLLLFLLSSADVPNESSRRRRQKGRHVSKLPLTTAGRQRI